METWIDIYDWYTVSCGKLFILGHNPIGSGHLLLILPVFLTEQRDNLDIWCIKNQICKTLYMCAY